MQEDKFYKEMDEKNSRSSCCTCQTMAIFFTLVFLISAGGIFYIYYQVTKQRDFPKVPTAVSTSSIIFKLSNIKPDNNGQISMTISEAELTALISSGFSSDKFILKETQATIDKNGIYVLGTLTKPINSKVRIKLVPEVQKGVIKFKTESITAGNFTLPGILSKNIGDSFAGLLENKITPIYQYVNVTNINLGSTKFIITGTTKK